MADFSKFRESGDLSDIVVRVGSQEHKLHKFPLFARSDYFCHLARPNSHDAERFMVELSDFPGGNEIFKHIADFCYNMPVNLNKNNVVAITCAAEYLKMFGPGNLKDISVKFLMETLASAKISRSTSLIESMLMKCNEIGEVAETAGVVDVCLEAFVECWMKPGVKYRPLTSGHAFIKVASQNTTSVSAFTRIGAPSVLQTLNKLDDDTINSLLSLRPEWFAMLLAKARARGIGFEELGNLAVKYISSALEIESNDEDENSCVDDLSNTDTSERNPVTMDDEKDVDTNTSLVGYASLATDYLNESGDTTGSLGTKRVKKIKYDLGTVLDKVILVLPDQALNIPAVTMEWLTKAINVATLHSCDCKGKLVRIAGDMLAGLDPADLGTISPSVLRDIIVDASDEEGVNSTKMSSDKACRLVDKYMLQKSREGSLTSEAFRLLASATKSYTRQSHDSLYTALEFVLKSEGDKLTLEQKQDLTEFVNLDLLSETNLQKALDEEIVPAAKIARSALNLCIRLRSDLASVKYIEELQEEDIQKYHTAATRPSAVTNTDTHMHRNGGLERANHKDDIDTSFSEATRSEDQDSGDRHPSTDPLRAAQDVLSAARHKLNLPVYTGYRPAFLSRLHPSTYAGHAHLYNYPAPRGHDVSLEDDLEHLELRPFHSLDPRIRPHRYPGQQHPADVDNVYRTYFPYSSHSVRF